MGLAGTLRWADASVEAIAAATGDEAATTGGIADNLTTGRAWPVECALDAGIDCVFVDPL
jgi:hypothetical protein